VPMTLEYGEFAKDDAYCYRATVAIEARSLGWTKEQATEEVVAAAQDLAARFVGDGECLTQQLAAAQRESLQRRDALVDEREKVRTLRLKVRRLQRELKKARGE